MGNTMISFNGLIYRTDLLPRALLSLTAASNGHTCIKHYPTSSLTRKHMCGERVCVFWLCRAVARSDVGGGAAGRAGSSHTVLDTIRSTCSDLIQLSMEPRNSSVRGERGENEK